MQPDLPELHELSTKTSTPAGAQTSMQAGAPDLSTLMRGPLALTPMTPVLILINVGVFVAMLFHGAGLWHSPSSVQLAWGASFGPATKDGQWWRLATAMFLHFGLLHLAMNMWALWDVGRFVERLYGSWRYTLAYLAAGLAGNLLSLLVQGDHAVSGGASGAVFGVYGALVAGLWRERRQVHPTEFRWLFGGAALFAVAMIAAGTFIPGIDNAAHLGGFVFGALAGTALLPPLWSGSPRAAGSRWAAGAAFLLLAGSLAWAIPAPVYRWNQEVQTRREITGFLNDDQRIAERWRSILDAGREPGASFDALAQKIDSDVTQKYEQSFEQLSALKLDPGAPSAQDLNEVKKYAQIRATAARMLAEGLRNNDRQQINAAIEMARRAAQFARGTSGNADTGHQPAP
jgi:rhomboid protease GluP